MGPPDGAQRGCSILGQGVGIEEEAGCGVNRGTLHDDGLVGKADVVVIVKVLAALVSAREFVIVEKVLDGGLERRAEGGGVGKISIGDLVLFGDPFGCLRAVGVLEPAVGIRNLTAVEVVNDGIVAASWGIDDGGHGGR